MTIASLLTGRVVSLLVGEDTITNCRVARWRTVHTLSPRLLPSSKVPIGWLQSHIWIEGEFGLLSLSAAVNAYLPAGEDTLAITPFEIRSENAEGTPVTYAFTGTILQTVNKMLEGGEPVFMYHFLAYSNIEVIGEKPDPPKKPKKEKKPK